MNQSTENAANKSADRKNSRKKDPRHIITPDAFTVADAMLGLPLATPKRRAFAITLDLLIIQQLTQIGSMVLGLCIALILFLLSQSKGRKTVGTVRKSIFRFLAFAMLFYVVLIESIDYFQTREFSILKTDLSDMTVIEENIEQKAAIEPEISLTEQLALVEDELAELKNENRALKNDEDTDIMDLFDALAMKFGYGFGWAGVYFTLFTYLLRGQTPGKLILRIKVVQLDGQRLTVWNSFGRYGGYAASAVTGLAGFLQIFWDPNRQGLHDKVSGTVVIKI